MAKLNVNFTFRCSENFPFVCKVLEIGITMRRLVKSFILSIWDTRKNKLYDDQDSEPSGCSCSCSCPLTGVLTSSASGCMWSMASVLRQQHEYFILLQEPTKKPLHPLHLLFCFRALYHYVLTPTFYHCT